MTIFSRPDWSVKDKLAATLFGVRERCKAEIVLEDFFDFYVEELQLLRVGASEQTWLGAFLAVKEHSDILLVVEFLRTNHNKTKEEICHGLLNVLSNSDLPAVERSVDLAVRLWLMINVRDMEHQSLRPLETCQQWPMNRTLDDFVLTVFAPQTQQRLSLRDSRLDINFTLAAMTEICGFKIHWTRNICDHLLLNRRRRIISIFAYEHCIELANSSRSPIPMSVLEETVQSLNLLLPTWDRPTEIMLVKEGRLHPWWAASNVCTSANLWDGRRVLTLNDFPHWQQRLIELNEIFRAPPVTWTQLWKDRRNPHLYWTFWLAFAIFLLTLGQFITSAIQAWASLQALKQHG